MKIPLDNTYGTLLYSNYKLETPEVRFLVEGRIPSIHSILILPSQEKIQVHTIHPTIPVPQYNPSSADRDAEMMKVGKMAKNTELPVIVTGDINDVACSQTKTLFQDVSRLLDLRTGRGFYNIYNADSWLMRWPPELFISENFRVIELSTGNPN